MARRPQYIEIREEKEPEDDALPVTGLVAVLVDLAGARSFQAGRAYFHDGAVTVWEIEGRELTGKVVGTDAYEVELLLKTDGLGIDEYACDCPYHEDQGAFCKHCVALGLAFATSGQSVPKPSEKGGKPKKDALTVYLENLEKPALIARILTAAREDRTLRQKLELEAASTGPREAQASALRKALESVLYVRDFLEYHEGRAWARQAESVLNRLRPLLKTDPALVIELSELALDRIEKALDRADDSDGEVSGLQELAQNLHLKACEAARPDPAALAERLWKWEQNSDFGTFYGAAQTYSSVLGETGLAEYRRLLRSDWDRLPALPPGGRESYDSRRNRLTSAMEALARADGDIDALVAIRSKDLSQPYSFLRIAETLLEARRGDEALAWAERGWASFPRPDERLAEFLISCYRKRKRYGDALEIAWKFFESRPTAGSARAVKTTAEWAGCWPEFREKIIGKLASSESVSFFLDEGDAEAAWGAARTQSCSDALWLKLAELRVKSHPEEAVAAWKRIAERWIDEFTGDYSEPVKLL